MLNPRTTPEVDNSIKYPKGRSPYAALIVRETTLDEAKSIADTEVRKSGHVCDSTCKDWEVIGR
jgi:hypothetical protein